MIHITNRFLLVDDDPLNNLISKMVLKKSMDAPEVIAFTIPENGLEYIQSEFASGHADEKTTLLLDINMPSMTGWEFLEKFDNFPYELKEQFNIYILSSSIDPADIQCAKQNSLIIDFIEKPLDNTKLINMFG